MTNNDRSNDAPGVSSGMFTLTKPIEVTPEMVNAGRAFLLCEEVEPYRDRDSVLTAIYRAMETARRLRRSGTTSDARH